MLKRSLLKPIQITAAAKRYARSYLL